MIILGVKVWIWCVSIAVFALAAWIWSAGKKAGKKARTAFYEQLFQDLQELLIRKAGVSADDAVSIVRALKNDTPPQNIPEHILRIEYAMEYKDAYKANRILAIGYMDENGKPMLSKIEREYDRDFIPDELAEHTIRSGKNTVNIELYTKK